MRLIHSSLLVVSLAVCAAVASASCTTTGGSQSVTRTPAPRASGPAANVRWFKAPAGALEINPCFLGRGAIGRFAPGGPGDVRVVVGISPEGCELFRKRIDSSAPVLEIKEGPATVVSFLVHDTPDIRVPCFPNPSQCTCTPTTPPPTPCDPGGN
jgi:hypothetical protein